MNISMPGPNDLQYFVEVSHSLNLSRASERLGISQPSLSVAIRRLEETVGTQLLIRTKRGVSLTHAGKQLLVHSLELLQLWDRIKGRALASTEAVQGTFKLGCHASVAIYSLPLFLAEVLEEFPLLELKLVHDLSRKISEAVIQMEIDIGIVVNPVQHPDLIVKKLCKDQVTLWVAEGKREIQNLKSDRAVLICDPDLLQTQELLRKLKKMGFRYSRILPSTNLEVVRSLTQAGAGIGLLPGRVALSGDGPRLKSVSGAPEYQDEVCLIYRHELKTVRSIQTLSEVIQKAFKT